MHIQCSTYIGRPKYCIERLKSTDNPKKPSLEQGNTIPLRRNRLIKSRKIMVGFFAEDHIMGAAFPESKGGDQREPGFLL